MKKAALICVTRNNAEKLQTTLNSIILNTNPDHYDLIIIDNASSDSTLGIYQQRILAENITIVRSGKNLNWVGGINLGLEMTKGYQYVGFLNDDIEVCPNWLENFFDVLDCNPDVAAVGPITSNTIDWQGYDNLRFLFKHWKLPKIPEIDRQDMVSMYGYIKNNGVGIPTDWEISLFCILVKRKTIKQLGLFDNEWVTKVNFEGKKFALSTRTYVICNQGSVRFENRLKKQKNIYNYKKSKIWVINLERRQDRLAKFKESHPDIANEIHVLKAYDGRSLRLTPKIARLFAPNNFAWNKATMGCSLSHLDLWYRLANEPDENASYLILEDDTKLSPNWREIVEQAFSKGDVPPDWDVVYLGGVLPKNESAFAGVKEKVSGSIYQVAPNELAGQNPPNRYFHFGAYAYILRHKGAKNLLRYINFTNGIWQQADFDLGYVFPPTYPVQLKHYFFDPFLAHCYQDLEPEFQKSYSESASEEPKKIDSDIWKESACFDESIAKSMVDVTEPYDISGALEEARKQMQVPSNTQNVKISLLHATRGRPIHALDAKELWLNKVKFPERVEHLFAIDHDDAESIVLKQHPHVIQLQDGYSVGAWNLAASKCAGDVLIQLSDDWLPPDGWDELIASRLNTDCEEVLWIDDGNRTDDLMCMAITTRKYYLRHGLFDPVFKNVYSDNDFTLRAKKAGAVVDARDIKIKHDHPSIGTGKSMDATYERGNQSAEYERAKAIFEAKHFPKIYSQNDEQSVIERFFGGAPGVLWDFGCNDGITLSNSHHILKNKGWKGILVDASPVCIEKAVALYAGRQDIQILNIGLGEKNGVFDFYESGTHLGKGDLSLVSSFKKESTQRWKPTTEYHVKKIQVCDFKTFLGDHARYKQADFITIDIEGLDYEILASIDLDQTQTRLVCVEHNGHDIQKYIDYCKKFGMEVISQNAENLIMGRRSINCFKIPAKAPSDDFFSRFREIVSDPLNLLIHRDPLAGLVVDDFVILHTGLKVPFSGPQSYYQDFSKILVINRGVHEPLEEYVFQQLINILPDNPSMIELGSYWAHYSMWLKSKRPNAEVSMVEPDPVAMKVGVFNFEHNGFEGKFINQFVGNGQFEIDSHIEARGVNQLDVLHCDIQGYELEMLNGANRSLLSRKINYLLISTHSQNLHSSACEILKGYGYRLEVQSDYDNDTTSLDGFIFASSPNAKIVFNEFEPMGRRALATAKFDQIFNYLHKCHATS